MSAGWIAAVILAAGRSSRMGRNKLLIEIDGRPLVDRSIAAALGAGLDPVVVVLGHDAADLRRHLAGRAVTLVENPDYPAGLSTSLRAGIASLDPGVAAAIICLADMPGVDARLLGRIAAAWDPARGRHIVVPVRDGRRGNPVLWDRRFFPELLALEGDQGARRLVDAHAGQVVEIAAEDDGIFVDLDTPEALEAWRRRG